MFVNANLDDIFLINTDDNTIHAASRLSEACGINGQQNGHFGVIPSAPQERDMMLSYFQQEFPELSLCPHCLTDEAKALEQLKKAREEAEGEVQS